MSQKCFEVSIIVPTFNEEENIPHLLERIDNSLRGVSYEVIIIDDCSTDNTVKVAQDLSNRYPVRIIRKIRRTGKPESILIGIREAKGKYVAFIDADLEYPPEIIRNMYEKAVKDNLDVVLARRIQKRRSLMRRVISIGAKFLAKLLLPHLRKIDDPATESLLVKRNLLTMIYIKPHVKPFVALLVNLLRTKPDIRISSVPCVLDIRERGRSSFNLKWIIEYIRELCELTNWFTLKYILVALLLAVFSTCLNPYIGIFSLMLSVLIRMIVFRRNVKLYGVPIAEAISTGLKNLLYHVLSFLWFFGWGLGALIELLIVHLALKS